MELLERGIDRQREIEASSKVFKYISENLPKGLETENRYADTYKGIILPQQEIKEILSNEELEVYKTNYISEEDEYNYGVKDNYLEVMYSLEENKILPLDIEGIENFFNYTKMYTKVREIIKEDVNKVYTILKEELNNRIPENFLERISELREYEKSKYTDDNFINELETYLDNGNIIEEIKYLYIMHMFDEKREDGATYGNYNPKLNIGEVEYYSTELYINIEFDLIPNKIKVNVEEWEFGQKQVRGTGWKDIDVNIMEGIDNLQATEFVYKKINELNEIEEIVNQLNKTK